jgi:hypothetical protein
LASTVVQQNKQEIVTAQQKQYQKQQSLKMVQFFSHAHATKPTQLRNQLLLLLQFPK